MADERRATGDAGEQLAAAWLERRGWVIMARNWRCRDGEVDIIACDPQGVVVLCEVKCRRGDGYGDPLEAITFEKVRRLRRLAAAWASTHVGSGRLGLRLDAIGVRTLGDGTSRVTYVAGIDS